MSNVGPEGRSFRKILDIDLRRLADIAALDRADFFRRYPTWDSLYGKRFLCSAFCQGAARHYVEGRGGINDFDVYSFYAENPSRCWYAKRRCPCDFGSPKFGRSEDRPDFIGRRVDLMGRGIAANPGDDPEEALRRYLREACTCTARLLAGRPVVLLEPASLRGNVVWPGPTGWTSAYGRPSKTAAGIVVIIPIMPPTSRRDRS